MQNGLCGHPAWRTTCASGFECADPAALSTAGPGPRRRGNREGVRNVKNFRFVILDLRLVVLRASSFAHPRQVDCRRAPETTLQKRAGTGGATPSRLAAAME